jgi:putative acetyltransferase
MTALRAFRRDDLQLIAGWANAFDLEKYVSRLRPRDALAVCHDPQNGLFWFVIVSSGVDVGTIWLEPGEQPNESILGVYLKDPSVFGRGIGSQAIQLALEECQEQYPARVITLRVRQDNAGAIACYKKLGFLITSRETKVLPSGRRLPCLQMQLLLPTRTQEVRLK